MFLLNGLLLFIIICYLICPWYLRLDRFSPPQHSVIFIWLSVCCALSSYPFWSDAPVREAKAEGGDGNRGQGSGRPPAGRPEDAGQADLWGLPQELQHEQGQGSNHSHRQDQHPCTLIKSSGLVSERCMCGWLLSLPKFPHRSKSSCLAVFYLFLNLILSTFKLCNQANVSIWPGSQYLWDYVQPANDRNNLLNR